MTSDVINERELGARFETTRRATMFANVTTEPRLWESSRSRRREHCDELVGHPIGPIAPASFHPSEDTVLARPPPQA